MSVAISAHASHPCTWDSYEAAVTSGAEYAEFDIRRTSDGVYVAHHDPIAGLTYKELCSRLGFEAPRIPELMAFLGGRLKGHLDLKETGYELEIVEMAISSYGMDGFVATGLTDAAIPEVKARFPAILTGLSLGEEFSIDRILACGADWVALRHTLADADALDACAQHGIGVMVWTVDEPALMDGFLDDPRVDVLITNLPQVAVATRRERLGGSPRRPGRTA